MAESIKSRPRFRSHAKMAFHSCSIRGDYTRVEGLKEEERRDLDVLMRGKEKRKEGAFAGISLLP